MALSGIDIFKNLPKTNCGDCGVPTCLAFAMKLAQGQAELASCPHVSDEAKAALSEACGAPDAAVTVGVGDTAFTVGEETVLFRHEKTFVHPCAIGVTVDAAADDAAIDARLPRPWPRTSSACSSSCGAASSPCAPPATPARFAAVVERVEGLRPSCRSSS